MMLWAPIAVALLVAIGAGWAASRAARNVAFGVGAALLVITLALVLFAQIASVAYLPAALTLLVAASAFVLGRASRTV